MSKRKDAKPDWSRRPAAPNHLRPATSSSAARSRPTTRLNDGFAGGWNVYVLIQTEGSKGSPRQA